MGRPPSKIHDPIGYERYYASSNIGGYILIIIAIVFLLKGC